MRIAINNYCNSKCPYCFAGNMGIDKNSNISIENFKKLLDKMVVNRDKSLILLGGEPTLHPQFEEILNIVNDYCRLFGWTFLLLSNAVKLSKYVDSLPVGTNILVNVNNDVVLGKKQFDEMILSLEALRDRGYFYYENNGYATTGATLGCNLYAERSDYDFFWSLVDRFDAKRIRVSVTSPANSKEHLSNRDAYFEMMKPIFMDFVIEAYKRRLIVTLDCNEIPPCYFTSTELYMIDKISLNGLSELGKCEPLFQTMPDMTVSCCFGDGDFDSKKKSIDDFKSLEEIEKFYEQKRAIRQKTNFHMERCKTCFLKEHNFCNAGCFGFTDGICWECKNEK